MVAGAGQRNQASEGGSGQTKQEIALSSRTNSPSKLTQAELELVKIYDAISNH